MEDDRPIRPIDLEMNERINSKLVPRMWEREMSTADLAEKLADKVDDLAMNKRINANLALLMETRGLSQLELARALDVDESEIARCRDNQLPWRVADLVVMASTYDVEVSFFFRP